MFTNSVNSNQKTAYEWRCLRNRLDTTGYQAQDERTLLRLLGSLSSTKITPLQKEVLSNPQIRDLYNTKDGERFLAKTIRTLNTHHFHILISCNHPLSEVNIENDSALLLAIRIQSIDMVRQILSVSSESDLNAANNEGYYPLEQAISTNNHQIILDILQSTDNISKLIPKKILSIRSEMYILRTLFDLKNESIALAAVERSKNIHLLHDKWGRTALYLAHINKFPLVALKLHNIGLHYYFSPQNLSTESLAHSVCLFASRYMHLVRNKKLHTFGCFSKNTTPILRYFYWKYMQDMKDSKNRFLNSALPSNSFVKDVSNALLLSSTQASSETLHNTYSNNKPILISTGWSNHEISVVIYGDFIGICNRGRLGLDQNHYIELRKINKQKLSTNVISNIQNCRNQDKAESEQYLFKDLLTELDANKDYFCRTLQNKIISIKAQKHANCTAASPKLGILALHILHHEKNNILNDDTLFKGILGLYHNFSRYLRAEIKNAFETRIKNNPPAAVKNAASDI